MVAALEPTFGGINLEDIKAPECFEVEERCKARMGIPVFHDDQHGTAIIVGAAVLNGLELAGKSIEDVKIVTSGAGAAALACLNLLVSLGARRENIWVTDIEGVVYEGRAKLMDRWKSVYAQKTEARALADVIDGADVFLGLSAGGVLKPEMLKTMGPKPLILALANPNPEIMPEVAQAARPDAMICTGRSDFPNQVNNVLCFPYIFRGALDVGATHHQRGDEARGGAAPSRRWPARRRPRSSARAYGGETRPFGPRPPDPQPVRPAADPAHRAGGGAGGDGHRASRRARSPTSHAYHDTPEPLRLPLRPHHEAGVRRRRRRRRSASSMPTARTSACCAPRRWCSRRGSRGRS